MTEIVWGSTRKPVASRQLARLIEKNFADEEGFLYVGYPVLSAAEGVNSIDALWVSPRRGVVIFHVVEGRGLEDYEAIQDEYANNLETKFRPHRELMRGRTLLAPPTVITYAPAAPVLKPSDGYPLANDDTLEAVAGAIVWDHPELYEFANSVVQSISSIRKGRRRRQVQNDGSMGYYLRQLENSIATLDSLQSRAVIETVEGVQRIRGLAGSGKTIVLALKAAYLHAQHPDWRIAVTFNTRSLKSQFVRLIDTFVSEQTGEGPIWENLQVVNAWGAPGGADRTGIYYQYVKAAGLEYHDLSFAKNKFSYGNEFDGVVEIALSAGHDIEPIFDVILVDEAQDFSPSFLRLCYNCLTDAKRLVYAYDELQSLTDRSLPPPEEIFGEKEDGSPRVTFSPPQPGKPSQDIILETCYRNSRPVLATAHALGFGIYRDVDPKTGTGLIQMFDNASLWQEVGYSVIAGRLADGESVTLSRTPETSPEFLEKPVEAQPLIEFVCFKNAAEQASWVAAQIEKNVRRDELNFDDIIVINPNPLTTVKAVAPIRRILFENEVPSHVAGVDTSADVFFSSDNDSVPFTGIFRAKGNEAGMVYVINGQDCFESFGNTARIRNQLFTAITRSKAWVRVTGYGAQMSKMIEEYSRVVRHDYQLSFVYPDEETRKHLNVINRDLTSDQKTKIRGAASSISELLSNVESGDILLEDLPAEQVAALRKLLGDKR